MNTLCHSTILHGYLSHLAQIRLLHGHIKLSVVIRARLELKDGTRLNFPVTKRKEAEETTFHGIIASRLTQFGCFHRVDWCVTGLVVAFHALLESVQLHPYLSGRRCFHPHLLNHLVFVSLYFRLEEWYLQSHPLASDSSSDFPFSSYRIFRLMSEFVRGSYGSHCLAINI